MRTTSIDIHLDDGEQPQVWAARHSNSPGTGYVHIGPVAIHGRGEDLAALLRDALDNVDTVIVGEAVAS